MHGLDMLSCALLCLADMEYAEWSKLIAKQGHVIDMLFGSWTIAQLTYKALTCFAQQCCSLGCVIIFIK